MAIDDNFLIKYDNDLYSPVLKTNPRGYTYNEAMDAIERGSWKKEKCILISIAGEIEKYQLNGKPEDKQLMEKEVFEYITWSNAYMDKNINKFSLPISVETDMAYVNTLKEQFEKYINEISKPAFVYNEGLIDNIKDNCDRIMRILQFLIEGEINLAEEQLKQFIECFIKDPFIVNELDKSYSFRGIAPFVDFQSDGYENIYQKMLNEELSFFRVRTKKKKCSNEVSKMEHIVHLPYEKRHNASDMRFSKKGMPCLYLGTTSFTCCLECEWKSDEEEMFSAAFVPNAEGKKLKILNLTISQALINGIYNNFYDKNSKIKKALQLSMLKMFPLIIATSFTVQNNGTNKRYEYLISQTLMKVINEVGIDGVAYLSMKGKNEFQYPQGVNLALPAYDIEISKQYSKYCRKFLITNPIRYKEQNKYELKSYINTVYLKKDEYGYDMTSSMVDLNGKNVYYGDTLYGKFDNYLMSQQKNQFNI